MAKRATGKVAGVIVAEYEGLTVSVRRCCMNRS